MNGQSGREWLGYQSRPATVLMILAAAMVACAWAYMLGTSRDPEPTWGPANSEVLTPQTAAPAVPTEVENTP